ncbi:MAG: hypothetical protein E6R04_01170 [Spirochaetes bacterium]|nr:MAG: hypothetical protein E6R04_01170 [Spirochaetota bacterium]
MTVEELERFGSTPFYFEWFGGSDAGVYVVRFLGMVGERAANLQVLKIGNYCEPHVFRRTMVRCIFFNEVVLVHPFPLAYIKAKPWPYPL